jgi:hypothetical protein
MISSYTNNRVEQDGWRYPLYSTATVNPMWMRVVYLIFILSLVAQAQPCRDIRSIDFRNAVIRTSTTDENELTGLFNTSFGAETFKFKNGVSEEFLDEAQRKAGTPESRATISRDSVLTPAPGVVVRFLVVTWGHQGPGGHSFVLGFVCRDRVVQQIFQFSSEYGPKKFAIGAGDQLVIEQGIWSEQDPHCCPTQTRTLYYAWNMVEQRFRRVRVDGPRAIETQH